MPVSPPGRLPPKLALPFLALAGLTACGTRSLIFRADLPGTTLHQDGNPTYRDSRVEIVYDSWSLDGVPFVSVYNRTDTTLLLDLRASRLGDEAWVPGLLRQPVVVAFVERDGRMYGELEPGSWWT